MLIGCCAQLNAGLNSALNPHITQNPFYTQVGSFVHIRGVIIKFESSLSINIFLSCHNSNPILIKRKC